MIISKSKDETTTQVINYYISIVNNYNSSSEYNEQAILSMKRLQKLVYLFEVLYMKEHHGKSYLNEDFYCWPSGPVIPKIYYKHMDFKTGSPIIIPNIDLPPQKIQELVNYILELTNDLETADLEKEINCTGSPWFEVMHSPRVKTNYSIYGHCLYGFFEQPVPSYELVISKRKIYHYYKDRNIL